jgi:hypothetical protein
MPEPVAPAPGAPAAPAPAPAAPAAPEPAKSDAPAAPAADPAKPAADPAKPADDAAKPAAAADELDSTKKPSLLEQFDKDKKAPDAAAAKPGDAKPDAKPGEPAAPAAAAVAPIAYQYEVPEVITMDDASRGQFHTALDTFRANPADPTPLISLYAEKAQEFKDFTLKEQHRIFNETREGWRKEAMADEQMGGSGFQTSLASIARMRDLLVAEADRPKFEEFMRVTGAGDHPQFLKLLHNAARYFDEPGLPPPNPKPAPTNGQATEKRGRIMYDHPRSNVNRN